MSDVRPDTTVWERLDTLDDSELKALVAAASSVVAEGDAAAQEIAAMPPGPAARELGESLREEGLDVGDEEVDRLISDEVASREAAISALRELGRQPVLAEEIENGWRARGEMMIVDAGVISAGALLLLVMKLKRVKVGQTEVEFYEAKAGVLGAVRRFLLG